MKQERTPSPVARVLLTTCPCATTQALPNLGDAVDQPLAQAAEEALVIDDSLAMRTMTSSVLRRLGYRVQQAVDGREGLQMLKDGTFAVVICDYDMPEMNGFDCVRHFRIWEQEFRHQRQPIFCFTGSFNDEPQVAGIGLEAGMDVVMEKPFSKSKLECALGQAGQQN